MWDKFIFGFCKVEFLCWHGDPNWLGWIVLGIFGLFILLVALIIVVSGGDESIAASRIEREQAVSKDRILMPILVGVAISAAAALIVMVLTYLA